MVWGLTSGVFCVGWGGFDVNITYYQSRIHMFYICAAYILKQKRRFGDIAIFPTLFHVFNHSFTAEAWTGMTPQGWCLDRYDTPGLKPGQVWHPRAQGTLYNSYAHWDGEFNCNFSYLNWHIGRRKKTDVFVRCIFIFSIYLFTPRNVPVLCTVKANVLSTCFAVKHHDQCNAVCGSGNRTWHSRRCVNRTEHSHRCGVRGPPMHLKYWKNWSNYFN